MIVDSERTRRESARADYMRAAAGLLSEMRALGFEVNVVRDLYAGGRRYKRAVPVLISWLGRIDNERAERDLVRALTDSSARPAAAQPLVARFESLGPDAPQLGLKWDIGHALAVVADDSVFDRVVELIEDPSHGRSREWLVVALSKMSDPRAPEAARRALDDPQLTAFALRALGQMKRPDALADVERYLDDSNKLIRTEAKRAATKLKAAS